MRTGLRLHEEGEEKEEKEEEEEEKKVGTRIRLGLKPNRRIN